MEHCVWAAGELILKHDVPGPDQSNGVGEGGGAALGETADVVTPGGPYRPTYRKKESPCTGTNSGFRNTDYSNVVKILWIRIISCFFFQYISLPNISNLSTKIHVLPFKIVQLYGMPENWNMIIEYQLTLNIVLLYWFSIYISLTCYNLYSGHQFGRRTETFP